MRTNVEKLTLLPSGSPHKRATELLASDAMAKLLRRAGIDVAVLGPSEMCTANGKTNEE